MAQRDALHDAVKQALVRDGWEITDDPHVIAYGELVISDLPLQLLLVDVEQVEVKKWIPARPIEKL